MKPHAPLKLYAPLAIAYVTLVVLANWLASKYLITVPFTHYLAPAGVLCIGAVFDRLTFDGRLVA